MRTLGLHLWKEWRDHRAVLVAMAVAVPALLGLAAAFLPAASVQDPILATVAALACFALVVLAIGADLVPGEDRRGHLAFLRRLPGGLLPPFLAKLVFLGLCLAAFPAWGWAVAGAGAPDASIARSGWLPLALGATPWVVAVSCWLPRGSLAIPGTALLLGLGALPLWLMAEANPGMRVHDAEAATVLMALGALGVAALSFVRGYRLGGGIGSAAWRGLLATLVLFSAAWAYGGHRVHEWRTIDPRAADFRISWAGLGEGGRFLFLNAERSVPGPSPTHALVVDLETGEWGRRGDVGDRFRVTAWIPGAFRRLVPLADAKSEQRVEVGSRHTKYWVQLLDGRTAEPVRSGWSDMLGGIHDGLDAPGLPEGWRAWAPAGLGYRVDGPGAWGFYDPFRKRVYTSKELRPWSNVHVRPGRWLVRSRVDTKRLLLDPDTGETAPVVSLPDRAIWIHVVADGRLLLVDRATRAVILLDPESGESRVAHDGPVTGLGAVPGTPFLQITTRDGSGLARLDLATSSIRIVPAEMSWFDLVAVPDERTVVVVEEWRRVVRVRLDDGRREVLFP